MGDTQAMDECRRYLDVGRGLNVLLMVPEVNKGWQQWNIVMAASWATPEFKQCGDWEGGDCYRCVFTLTF